jgi:glucose-1-phosphate adenylyltransferase
MDLQEMLRAHQQSNAAATVAMKAVPAAQTSAFGIMKTDAGGRVVRFEEKPPPDRLVGLDSPVPSGHDGQPAYLASMGIYVFARAALKAALANPEHVDFGKHVIPAMLDVARVQSYLYDGYWEDVGTIRSYYEANLALTARGAPFAFHHPQRPIYMDRPFLAPTKVHRSRADDALISDGGFLDEAEIETSVIGPRARIGRGARIRRSLVLGADFYESASAAEPLIGIGDAAVIENAIIDKNARIGRNVRIINVNGVREHDGTTYFIRDGIVVVPKNAVIPDGTVI